MLIQIGCVYPVCTIDYYWDRGYIIAEGYRETEQTASALDTVYYLGADGIFAQKGSNGTSYLLKNGHGDTVTDGKQRKRCRTYQYEYSPYGEASRVNRVGTNAEPPQYRYANSYWDYDIGLLSTCGTVSTTRAQGGLYQRIPSTTA